MIVVYITPAIASKVVIDNTPCITKLLSLSFYTVTDAYADV